MLTYNSVRSSKRFANTKPNDKSAFKSNQFRFQAGYGAVFFARHG